MALEMYFSPNKEDERTAAITSTLISMDRSINNASDSTKIVGEVLVSFIKTWMASNPPLE